MQTHSIKSCFIRCIWILHSPRNWTLQHSWREMIGLSTVQSQMLKWEDKRGRNPRLLAKCLNAYCYLVQSYWSQTRIYPQWITKKLEEKKCDRDKWKKQKEKYLQKARNHFHKNWCQEISYWPGPKHHCCQGGSAMWNGSTSRLFFIIHEINDWW